MKSFERERFTISLLSALFLHALIVLLLGFVDLGAERSLSHTLPPVTVRLEPLTPVQPRELPEEAPEERETPSPEAPVPAPEAELPQASDQAPAASSAPASSPQPAAQAPELSRETSSSGWTVPEPTDAARQRAAQEVEQGPRDDFSSRSTEQETEAQPASSAREAEEYGQEVPEQRTTSSEGSKIVYAEEPPQAQSSGPSQDAGRQGEGSQEESIVDSRLLEELEGVESGGAGATGTSQGRASDDASGSGSSGSPSSSFQSEQGQVDVVVGEGDEQRELLEYSLPDLTPEQLSQLPREFEVIVEFSLQANGIPFSVYLPQGSSTGYPEVDNRIVEAVRNWKFNPLPSGSTRTMTGKARILIRAR